MKKRLSALPWPKLAGQRYVACHFCDTLHHLQPLPEGHRANCSCCGVLLYQNPHASLMRAVIFSITSLILMALTHMFPFMAMDAAGIRKHLTLVGSVEALQIEGEPLLGACVMIFAIFAPLMMSIGLIYVCAPLMFGYSAPKSGFVARMLFITEPWNMIEVFLLAVIVSLLKLAKVAEVHFEIGFWTFAALMICMAAATAGIDKHELWDRLEVAKS